MKAKRVTVSVATWSKHWISPYDGPCEGRLEVFPLPDGAFRLTSSMFIAGKRHGAVEVWSEDAGTLATRQASMKKEKWKRTLAKVSVDARDVPRPKSDSQIASDQYAEEMRAMLRKG